MDKRTIEFMIHSFANVNADVLALRDMLLVDIKHRNNLDEKQIEIIMRNYEKDKQMYLELVNAAIRNRFDPNLGSIDDLIEGIE